MSAVVRLVEHRQRVRESGHTAELLSVVDLTDAEKLLLFQSVVARAHAQRIRLGGPEFYQLYSSVLAEWGVTCPHPEPMRGWGGLVMDRERCWTICRSCGCIVV